MDDLKHNSQRRTFWGAWIVICLNILHYNTVKCEGKTMIILANGEEREETRPLESYINTPLKLECNITGSNVNISNDKGKLLSSGVGDVSFFINSTTCQDAGTYICQAPRVAEKKIVVFIDTCNPVLCYYKQKRIIIQANLSADAHVSICFLTKDNAKNFVMKYNNRWIRQDSKDEKIQFEIIRSAADSLYHTLNITIRNISVFDYGEVSITLVTTAYEGLEFNLSISDGGPNGVQFNHTLNGNDYVLTCTAYNYPTEVLLRRKSLNSSLLASIKNPLAKPQLKLRHSFDAGSCSVIGTFECYVTYFNGLTQTYEYSLEDKRCSDILKLCDWQERVIKKTVYPCGAVNFTVCVLNTFRNNDLIIAQTPSNSFNYSIKGDGVYSTIWFTMHNVKETSFRDYTIAIGQSIDVKVHIHNKTGPTICNHTFEQNIQVKPGERAMFSVKVEKKLKETILINNRLVPLNSSSQQYRVMEETLSTGEIKLTIEIVNFTTRSTPEYNIQISSKSGPVMSYKIVFTITDVRIQLCPGDQDNVTVNVTLNSPAVVHLCVSSNVGLGDFISIDKNTYEIYGPNRTTKYCVSADIINQEQPNHYYIQIYLRNATGEDMGTHEIIIRPTKDTEFKIYFCLQLYTKDYPVGCDKCVPKTFYFANVGEMCTINVCVLTKETTKHRTFLNEVEHVINATNQSRSFIISCSYETTGFNNITKHTIKLRFYVESANFTRHKLKVLFGEDVWNHTFYLVDNNSLNNVKCIDGTTEKERKNYIFSNVSFCIRVFGLQDSFVLINNEVYPIEPHFKPGKKKVVQYFTRDTLVCHLEIYINNLTIIDFGVYHVSLSSIDNIYNFTVVMDTFPLEIEFYDEHMKTEIGVTSLTKQATLGQHTNLTCKLLTQQYYPLNLSVTFQSKTLIETNNDTHVRLTVERFQCKDVGTYACVADMGFQHSRKEVSLLNNKCDPRWCKSQYHNKHYTASYGRDFLLPLCLHLYSDACLTFILNGTDLSSNETSKYRYDAVRYDNKSMMYRVNIIVRDISLADYGDYKITVKNCIGTSSYMNLSFSIQDHTSEKTKVLPDSSVIIIFIAVSFCIAASFAIFIFCFKKRARRKRSDRLNSVKVSSQMKNEIDFHENGLYANMRNIKLNNDYENMKGLDEIIPLVDMNDLNKKMDNRIYMNSQETLERAPRYGYKTDKENWKSLTDPDSNGLLYVTLAPRDGPVPSMGSRQHQPKDEVVYASLDYSKTGRLTLKEMDKLGKQSAKRKKYSQKKNEKTNASKGKISSLPHHGAFS